MKPSSFPVPWWNSPLIVVRLLLFLAAAGTWAPCARAASPLAEALLQAKRVVFLGDSITYAGEWVEFVETWTRLAHPEATVDFLNVGLPSETVSGLSEPGHAGGAFPRPDVHERLDRVLAKAKPDLIVACYGMNCGIYHPYDEVRAEAFRAGIRKLREKAAAAGAKVIHLTSATFDPVPLGKGTLPAGLAEYRQPFEGYDGVLERYANWLVEQRASGWWVIDVHGPMAAFLGERRRADAKFRLAGDGVHPTTQGHWLIAREVLRELGAGKDLTESEHASALRASHPKAAEVLALVQQRHRARRDAWLSDIGHLRPGMGKGKPVAEVEAAGREVGEKIAALLAPPFPGKRSDWNGFDRYDFEVGGRPVLVVTPHKAAPGKPWVWHGEFFGHRPAPDIALLGKGFHVVYLSVPDMLGSPKAVAHWNTLYAELTSRYGLSRKPALVGLSRGGLYCYNWATANPDKVACIYGDAPVCDFKSWPGGKGAGPGSARDWKLVMQEYGFASEAEALAYRGNPVDSLTPLSQAGVPLLHVYGDADEVVPWEENTKVVAERYRIQGGIITLIAKPGGKHHPHGLEDSTPIVEFILKNAGR